MDAKPCLSFIKDPLLKPIIAARTLGVSSATLQRMAREQRVPALRIGKFWQFPQSDLEAWIESKLNVKS